MGAHGTFDDALAGVTAFHAGGGTEVGTRGQRRGGRAADKGKAKKERRAKEDKKGRRDKKDKSKRKKVSKRKDGSDGDASSAESDDGPEDLDLQLERGRMAVRLTRDIMSATPSLKKELREVRLGVQRSAGRPNWCVTSQPREQA